MDGQNVSVTASSGPISPDMNEPYWAALFRLTRGALDDAEAILAAAEGALEATLETPELAVDEATAQRLELDSLRFLQTFVRALRRGLVNDCAGSAEDFERATAAASSILAAGHPDGPRRHSLEQLRAMSQVNAPLARARAYCLGLDRINTLRELTRAEQIAAPIAKRIEVSLANLPAGSIDDEQLGALLADVLLHLGFFLQATLLHGTLYLQGGDMHITQRFFERHGSLLQRALAVSTIAPLVAQSEPLAPSLLAVAEAHRALVDARINLVEGRHDTALARYQDARHRLVGLIELVPHDNPIGARIPDQAQNLVTFALPQVEEQARRERDLLLQLEFLQAQDEARAGELREFYASRERLLEELAKPRPTSNFTVYNQNEANIRIGVRVGEQVPNAALDEMLRLLREQAGALPAAAVEEIEKEAKAAKEETDLQKKIERVAGVIEAFGKVAEAASNALPYGNTVYRVLKALLVPRD